MSRQPDDYDENDAMCHHMDQRIEMWEKAQRSYIDEHESWESERIEALEAALAEAHRIILHELDNGRTPYLLPVDNGGKGLGYFEDVLEGLTTDRS